MAATFFSEFYKRHLLWGLYGADAGLLLSVPKKWHANSLTHHLFEH